LRDGAERGMDLATRGWLTTDMARRLPRTELGPKYAGQALRNR
jgi:hypothetical protein